MQCRWTKGNAVYISNDRWTSYCFGGVKNHKIFQFMQRAYEEYWKQEDASIDYLLVDYLLHICCTDLKCGREIEEIPISNLHRNDLSKAMLSGRESSELEHVLQGDTDFSFRGENNILKELWMVRKRYIPTSVGWRYDL